MLCILLIRIVFYVVVMLLGRNNLTLSRGFVYVVPVTSSFAIKSLVLNYGNLPRIQIATDNIPKKFESHM